MKSIFLLICLWPGIIVYSQRKKVTSTSELKTKVVSLDMQEPLPGMEGLPFSAIEVLDYRPDTSKIGFNAYEQGVNFKKITVKNGLQYSVNNFYNFYCRQNFSGDSTGLLIIIKKFWIDPSPNRQRKQQDKELERDSDLNLYLEFDFFLKRRGLYFPFRKIDTVYQATRNKNDIEYNRFRIGGYNFFEYVLARTFELPDYKFHAGKFDLVKNKKTFSELNAHYEKKRNYPILKDSFLRPGVYMNFQEFRNNLPSVTAYTISQEKVIGKVLYKAGGTDTSRISHPFGYCDGKNIYCGDLEYPIIRIGDTFEYLSTRTDRHTINTTLYYGNNNFGQLNIPVTEKTPEPFQIDMETGKIY
ncbi:MAG: hypothetical protein QM791_14590 [Ferruginibacter sp.]